MTDGTSVKDGNSGWSSVSHNRSNVDYNNKERKNTKKAVEKIVGWSEHMALNGVGGTLCVGSLAFTLLGEGGESGQVG